jgi:hypothetical protein
MHMEVDDSSHVRLNCLGAVAAAASSEIQTIEDVFDGSSLVDAAFGEATLRTMT